MTDYRLYELDPAGHIIRAVDLTACDDGDALGMIRSHPARTDLELWCGKRKVALIPNGGAAIWLAANPVPAIPA